MVPRAQVPSPGFSYRDESSPTIAPGTQGRFFFNAEDMQIESLVYLPHAYEERADWDWPMIVSLHGAGERGNDLELLKRYGIPKICEEREDFPFIALSPQCPPDMWWSEFTDALTDLVVDVMNRFHVDPTRVYLTGVSMGGYGAWRLAAENPELFAAVAPICGGGFEGWARDLVHTPVWAFHGEEDDVVPIHETRKMVEAIEREGGDVRFTAYEGVGHNSWDRAYDDPELFRWFLNHRRPTGTLDATPG